jgi:uncharacterized protein
MSATLLDVNVLIALFDSRHAHFELAHTFFATAKKKPWATTPLTIDGFVRIASNPNYPNLELSPHQSAASFRQFCDTKQHVFWPDTISIADARLLRLEFLSGHKQISDAHLLALAVKHNGTLATFDRKIPLKAVVGASERHLIVL